MIVLNKVKGSPIKIHLMLNKDRVSNPKPQEGGASGSSFSTCQKYDRNHGTNA